MKQTIPLKKSILSQVGGSMLLYSMLSPVALGGEPFAIVIKPGVIARSIFSRMQLGFEESLDRIRLFKAIGPVWFAVGDSDHNRFFSGGVRKALGAHQNHWMGGYVYRQSGSPFTSWGVEYGREALQLSGNFSDNLEGARAGGVEASLYCGERSLLGFKMLPHLGYEYVNGHRPFVKGTIRLPRFLNCFAIDVKYNGNMIFGVNISGDRADWLDRQINSMPYLSISPKAHSEKIRYKRGVKARMLQAAEIGALEQIENNWNQESKAYSVELLSNAAIAGHLNVINFLFKQDKSLDQYIEALGFIGIAKGNSELVNFSLGKAMNPNCQNKKGENALHTASQNGRVEVAELLLERGADVNLPNAKGYTPLHTASQNGRVEVAELLLERGADVNKKNKQGQTALHIASQNGRVEVAELLLKRGADVNMSNVWTKTALHIACEKGHTTVAQYLVEKGADVNLQEQYDHHIALHLASQNGSVEVAKFLLERGADVNKKNKQGQTALHIACEKGHTTVAKILIQAGADKHVKDKESHTPLYMATKNVYEFVKILTDSE